MPDQKKKILTKDQILQAKDARMEEVEVPEWEGSVFVRSLTGKERDQLEAEIIQKPGQRNMENLRAKLITLSVVDKEGNRLFDLKDAVALGGKNARALDRLFAVAQRLSGLTQKDMEELTKN